jgi:hypothetical protein
MFNIFNKKNAQPSRVGRRMPGTQEALLQDKMMGSLIPSTSIST